MRSHRTSSKHDRSRSQPLFEALEDRTLLAATFMSSLIRTPAVSAGTTATNTAGTGAFIGGIVGTSGGVSQATSLSPTFVNMTPVSQAAVTGSSASSPTNLGSFVPNVSVPTPGFVATTPLSTGSLAPLGVGGLTPTSSVGLTPTNSTGVTFTNTTTGTTPLNSNGRTLATVTSAVSHSFTGTIGTFTLPATSTATAGASSFTALITWGDGTRSVGTVVANDNGSFSVTGAHVFGRAGTFRVSAAVSLPAATGSAAFNTTLAQNVRVR